VILRYEAAEKASDEVWDTEVMAIRDDLMAAAEELQRIGIGQPT
jgi:hypothetical protein